MTFRRLLNVVYTYLITGADEKARDEFDRDLNAPLAGWATVQRRLLTIAGEAG